MPEGNGEFSDAMGLLVDKTAISLGNRSWRYSMLVKDGLIEKTFIEPEKPGDPFKVSDADTVLHYINATAPAACHLLQPTWLLVMRARPQDAQRQRAAF